MHSPFRQVANGLALNGTLLSPTHFHRKFRDFVVNGKRPKNLNPERFELDTTFGLLAIKTPKTKETKDKCMDMVMKLDKFLCFMFLSVFLVLSLPNTLLFSRR